MNQIECFSPLPILLSWSSSFSLASCLFPYRGGLVLQGSFRLFFRLAHTCLLCNTFPKYNEWESQEESSSHLISGSAKEALVAWFCPSIFGIMTWFGSCHSNNCLMMFSMPLSEELCLTSLQHLSVCQVFSQAR